MDRGREAASKEPERRCVCLCRSGSFQATNRFLDRKTKTVEIPVTTK